MRFCVGDFGSREERKGAAAPCPPHSGGLCPPAPPRRKKGASRAGRRGRLREGRQAGERCGPLSYGGPRSAAPMASAFGLRALVGLAPRDERTASSLPPARPRRVGPLLAGDTVVARLGRTRGLVPTVERCRSVAAPARVGFASLGGCGRPAGPAGCPGQCPGIKRLKRVEKTLPKKERRSYEPWDCTHRPDNGPR